MKLRELLNGVPVASCAVDLEMEITGVSYDSRATQPGDLFVAMTGYATDGHKYIATALEKGAVVDGVSYGPVKAEVETEKGTNAWLIVTLSEGKNREIRKLMKSIGLDVARLIRLSYGPFQLGSLKKGEVREVPGKVLKEQLGSKFQL